ncbi:CPBP family intramembrane glutamic endopeptidase [Marinactinospora thermotolerans]|uniref:CPBP family intramembrane glutamic endopeptidase n=1 Tax=Marinactinospora thermotolerans TaxID=531310 RepID=UPI001186CA61|nr:type II CAAX endopeptidase family protein [Marinactinospora thermotolerans]
MGNVSPPPGSSWASGAEGPDRPEFEPSSPAWAWPPGAEGDPVWAWPPPPAARVRRSRVVSVPPGTPYHRLARTARFRWWVPPLAVVAAVALYLLVQIPLVLAAKLVAVVAGAPLDVTVFFGSEVPDLAVELVLLAAMIPVVMFIARFVQWRPVGTLSSVEGRLRVRWLLTCSLVALLVVGVMVPARFGLYLATGVSGPLVGEWVGPRLFLGALLVVVLLVPFQAAAEEYALRGFVMQAVGSYGAPGPGGGPLTRLLRSPLPAILVSGGVFALLHTYSAWALAEVLCFGVAMAWLAWYTGGLEAPIALHVLHNLAAMGISAYEGTLGASGGSGSWQSLAGTVAQLVVYCLVVVWLARRAGLRRVVPGSAPAPDPACSPAPDPGSPGWALRPAASETEERRDHRHRYGG